jgi:hypothetical protein
MLYHAYCVQQMSNERAALLQQTMIRTEVPHIHYRHRQIHYYYEYIHVIYSFCE